MAPLFYSGFPKGDLTRIASAKFHGILIVVYILNEFKLYCIIYSLIVLDTTVALSNFPNMPLIPSWSLGGA